MKTSSTSEFTFPLRVSIVPDPSSGRLLVRSYRGARVVKVDYADSRKQAWDMATDLREGDQ